MSRLVNRNVTMAHGRTSMRLEPELWDALDELCARERMGLRDVVGQAGSALDKGGASVEGGALDEGGRTSAVRVHILQYFRAAATEAGHRAAGHGGKISAASALA